MAMTALHEHCVDRSPSPLFKRRLYLVYLGRIRIVCWYKNLLEVQKDPAVESQNCDNEPPSKRHLRFILQNQVIKPLLAFKNNRGLWSSIFMQWRLVQVQWYPCKCRGEVFPSQPLPPVQTPYPVVWYNQYAHLSLILE